MPVGERGDAAKLPGTRPIGHSHRLSAFGTASGQGGVMMKASAIWLWPGQSAAVLDRDGSNGRRIPNVPENKKEKSAFRSSSAPFEETRHP